MQPWNHHCQAEARKIEKYRNLVDNGSFSHTDVMEVQSFPGENFYASL